MVTERLMFFEVAEMEPVPAAPTKPEHARVVRPVRNQIEWAPRELDAVLPQDHVARAIWAFVERTDLSRFYRSIKAVVDRPGRPTADPRVVLAVWLYATAEGIGSARRLARLCEDHDAYRWLRGGVPLNYHLLSDFRSANEQAFNDLLTRMLAAMMSEGLVSLERVAQDGMRVRASAGLSSFRGGASLQNYLRQAQEQVERLAREREHPDPGETRRERAARDRAAREREQRVARALARLPEIEKAKQRVQKKDKKRRVSEPRVSTTDPDAQLMRMGDGGFRPAVNTQLATDTTSGVIVGVAVTNRGADQGEAVPMEQQIADRTGQHPREYLIDGGYVKHSDIVHLEQSGIRVYAPPSPSRKATADNQPTPPQPEDPSEILAWRERMTTPEATAIYQERAATAEWVNAQARSIYGVQQFRVRGLNKILSVMLMVAITHNLLRWIALTA